MIDVKISIGSHGGNLSFNNFYDTNNSKLKNYKFHVNKEIEKADFWFVLEDLPSNTENCKVPKNNVIYLNNETSFRKDYFFQPFMQKYLEQFQEVHSCYLSSHKQIKNSMPFLPWMIHANHGDIIFDKTSYNFQYFQELNKLEKKKQISVICSSKIHTENHFLRVEFLKILKSHFGSQLDWYGNGVNEIQRKHEGILDYKYHIVLENESRNNLISEKIFDSMLGLSVPIYYGAPNIAEYFNENSLHTIDINNAAKSIEIIEDIIKNDQYEQTLNYLIESKNKVLTQYNFVNRIVNIIENSTKDAEKSFVYSLNSSNYYWKKYTPNKLKIKRQIKRKLRIS